MKTKTSLLIAGLVLLSAMVVFTGTAYAGTQYFYPPAVEDENEDENGDNTHIPEFSTIAIPIASILGLLFFFSYRKRRRNE